jgi:hypothetical protein
MAKKARAESAGDAGPSKMQMVREALDQLGSDAKPKDIGDHVKAKYGADINPQMISSYKSTISGGGRSTAKGSKAGNVSLSDVEAVRGLVDRLGADGLTKLVRVLS